MSIGGNLTAKMGNFTTSMTTNDLKLVSNGTTTDVTVPMTNLSILSNHGGCPLGQALAIGTGGSFTCLTVADIPIVGTRVIPSCSGPGQVLNFDAASGFTCQTIPAPPASGSIGGAAGRYVYSLFSGGGIDAQLVDTSTGDIWLHAPLGFENPDEWFLYLSGVGHASGGSNGRYVYVGPQGVGSWVEFDTSTGNLYWGYGRNGGAAMI